MFYKFLFILSFLFLTPFCDTVEGLSGLFMAAEGSKAHIPLATGAETDTWGTDDVGTIEQCLKELPGAHAVGCAHPDIWSVFAAITFVAKVTKGLQHLMGVLHIVVDSGLHLSLSLRRVDGLGSALGDVATTIELRTLTTEPELVERDALALEGGYADILRHDGIATTDTRESCRL